MATHEEKEAASVLNRLVTLNIASEKGFNVAAENVKNRGLQVMFKSYAQERARFVEELRAIVNARDVEPSEGGGLLAAAHRGWINIKAAMTIGQPATEDVVLGEVVRGERVAVRRYEDALKQPDQQMPVDVLAPQFERVSEVSMRVQELAGRDGRRLVVRLFDSEADTAAAEEALAAAGFEASEIERVPLGQVLSVYEGQPVIDTTAETGFAGALVGASIGIILGVVAAVSALVAPGGPLFGMDVGQLFLLTVVLGAIAGALFGALIGAIIGLGISQEDAYRYADSMQHGSLLLLLRVDTSRAGEAAEIMKRVNARRWRLAT